MFNILDMKKLLPLIIIITAIYVGWSQFDRPNDSGVPTGRSDAALLSTFDEGNSGDQVEGNGIVIRILPDDTDGSRHQRFILKLDSGQTLLIAHNIDLAPRISALSEGDAVAFNGEYEWNPEGGVVHWTHHDPGSRHVSGWLKHNSKIYR